MRLSSSFEFEACAKVKPVTEVSAVCDREPVTPLTVVTDGWESVWRMVNEKWKYSSCALFSLSKKCGGMEAISGSYLASEHHERPFNSYLSSVFISQKLTWTNSMSASSEGHFAETDDAG